MTTVNLFDVVVPMVIVWVLADDLIRSLRAGIGKRMVAEAVQVDAPVQTTLQAQLQVQKLEQSLCAGCEC